ncbi:DUF2218 domain-containing protein [Streptomyces roseirectus]|uniref:DUF2218 domain-containing protein n=1 Tax=Streptomyces roseirectus TaxID=2768066 RepID=A0A7H0IES8_9ACTN|nr:DUF2218 domain-containing protein [Streptomyces roseirectus]QNP71294.1 DUF2218 domain-containing protein [Streptomyces roseirectus]
MPTSRARVATDTPARYAKQLASHLGRKVPAEETPEGDLRLVFDKTTALLHSAADHLLIEVTGPDAEAVVAIQGVVGSHLERFGRRGELKVEWEGGVEE